MTDNDIEKSCLKFAQHYDNDVYAEDLTSECILFKLYLTDLKKDQKLFFSDLYQIIKKECLSSTFPNIEICLHIFLSRMVTNCSEERSFSALKHLKNDRRISMTNSRLNSLSIMYIESDILNRIDYEKIISDFSLKESRKKL